MANFTRQYTGENAGIKLGENTTLRTQENMNQTILNADKLKLEVFQKNKDWILKQSDIDLQPLISTASAEVQSRELKEFNDWVVSKVKGGEDLANLSIDTQTELLRRKQILMSNQDRMMGDQKKYEIAEQMARRNPKVDYPRFLEEIGIPFATTGRFNDAPLPLLPKSPDAFFMNNRNKAEGDVTTTEDYYTNPNGKKVLKSTVHSATEQQARDFVVANLFNDEQLREGVFQEFSNLPESEQWKYLKDFDTDKSGKLDETELRIIPPKDSDDSNNPILRYAQDKYWAKARRSVEGKETGAAQSQRISFNWNSVVNAGNNQNDKFINQGASVVPSVEGDFNFPDYYNLGGTSQTAESQKIPRVVVKDDKGNEIIKPLNETALFHLVGYSKLTDRLYIQLDGNSSDNMTYSKGDLLVVPASDFKDLLKKKPFGIFREETPTIPTNTVTNVGDLFKKK